MSVKTNPQRRSCETGPVHIESLTHLDELVGRHVMETAPKIFWEDSYTQWRFDSLPEALEAMRDPFFSAFTPEGSRPRSSLKEVHEFPAFSSHLGTALGVVEQLGLEDLALTLQFRGHCWSAKFGRDAEVSANEPAVAICLAALRSRGVKAEFEEETSVPAAEHVLV